jgi:cytochrome c-type biogenesis protein
MELLLAAGSAFVLGVLTSISPCLLATNVTAITFIARRIDRPRYILFSGGCYTLGQALGFIALAALVVGSLVSVPAVSHWLQKYMFRVLGPILIIVGMFLVELMKVHLGSGHLKGWAQRFGNSGGLWATALLGLLFAMSFCPTTAALFFGGLIPIAITHESKFFLPLAYSVGVSVPVVAIVLLLGLAANWLGRVMRRVTEVEWWLRRAAGAVFIVVGIYFTLAYSLGLW